MTRSTRPATLLLLLLAASAPGQVQAQVQTPPQAPGAPTRPVTVWTDIDQPMSALLNGGHRVVAATGPVFTLEKGGKYVVCEIRPAGGMSGRRETTSDCHGVN